MTADSTDPLVEDFVARVVSHAYLVKMRLESEGASAVIQGKNLQIAAGEIPMQDAAPRILVRMSEASRARHVLRQRGE